MKYPAHATSMGKLTKGQSKKLHQISQNGLNRPEDKETA